IKPQELKVYSGNDDQTVPIMALGGDGVISVFSNICPVEMKWIADSILNNDMQTARNINNKYLELMNLLFVDVNPVPVKYAASLMNFTSDYVRLPLIPLSDKHRQVLSDKMKELNIVCC
ncbi:MAG TPA: dihydrodipicolinate synthase family protein, partial [Petrotogaceae bacterium]|nr:dihydrodipicolinate synthase family protein [Petrotogaceae bacterium]